MVSYFFVKPIKINGKSELLLRVVDERSTKHYIKKGWLPLDYYFEVTGKGDDVVC